MRTNSIGLYMTKNLVSIKEDASIKEGLKIMAKDNISHLIVKDQEEKLTGVISRIDLLNKMKRLANETSCKKYTDLELSSAQVKDIMTADLLVVKPSDAVEYAVELFLQKQFHCLPVVEDEQPVGIITMFDLLKGYYQEYG